MGADKRGAAYATAVVDTLVRSGKFSNLVNAPKLGCSSQSDRCRFLVADAWVSCFPAGVVVMCAPLECSWFGAVAALPVRSFEDLVECRGDGFVSGFRGKNPPAL